MGSTPMAKALVCVLLVAVLAIGEAGMLVQDMDIQCDKAGPANTAVCDAYGAESSICHAAKVQYKAHCEAAGDIGASLGSDPEDLNKKEAENKEAEDAKNAEAAKAAEVEKVAKEETPASGPAELPSLKTVMQPILQKCEEEYTKAKANCKTKVDARYKKYKEKKKQEQEAQLAKKRAEAEMKANKEEAKKKVAAA